jgi:ATP-binding cassette subfamily B protein
MADAPSELLKKPFRYYAKRHWRMATLGLFCLFVTNSLETMVPWLVGKALDQITEGLPLNAVGGLILQIFLIIAVLSLFRYLWRIFWSRFHHAAAEHLRNQIYDHMADLGPSFFKTHKIGELISLVSNDVNSFRMGIGPGLLVLFDGIFLVILILPVMISISPRWTLETLALMPLVPFVVNSILRRLHVTYHDRQNTFADMAGSAQEIVSGIRVIKSFAQENSQTAQFNQRSQKFQAACDRVARWDAFFAPALELPMALGCVILLVLGAPKVIGGEISIGLFFAFYQYIQRMVWPMNAIGIGLSQVQEGQAAFTRIRKVLETGPDVPDTGEIEITEFKFLEVKNLSFTYPGTAQPALKDISFTVRQGESLGIVGMTGSGKSTLMDLLLRQYPVPPGTILINGISVEKIRLRSLRALITTVPQEAFLFSRKVSENLALGMTDWEMTDVEEAAEHVHLRQEIESWPEGYNALVGERGVNLSGGQKQRMTLARALASSAEVVLLDDSLSAVDSKTEQSILSNLRSQLSRRTSIIVSHRLASVREANQIIVLKNGSMEGIGTHAELVSTSEIYNTLAKMQA